MRASQASAKGPAGARAVVDLPRAMRVVTILKAVHRIAPTWIRKRVPHQVKRSLLVRYWGITPFDFEGKPFDRVATADDIYYCYRLLLGRLPDPDGWKTYEGVVRGGLDVGTLSADFLASPEFRARALGRDGDSADLVLLDLGDVRMYVIPDDFVGRSLVRDRTYEPHVSAALRSHLSPGRVLVDVGAHAGYHSLMAARLVGPSGRVLSFEPSPVSCSLLLRNVRVNGFLNVEVHPFAVAEARGVVRIEGRGSHARIVDPDESSGTLPSGAMAMAVTLDEALRDVPRVDVIKMDIEGAEFRALQGARETIARHRAVIFSELSPAGLQNVSGVSAKEYLQALIDAGYGLSAIDASSTLLACGTDVDHVLRLLDRSPATHLDIVAHPR